jgi:hypothetical protein
MIPALVRYQPEAGLPTCDTAGPGICVNEEFIPFHREEKCIPGYTGKFCYHFHLIINTVNLNTRFGSCLHLFMR